MSTDGHGKKRRMGVVLCGGGITGAMYEVGCLAAIEEAFEGFRASDFDVFIGASSGSTLAMALAGGLSAQRVYRALLDPADDFFPLKRQHLLHFDPREVRRAWGSAFNALRRLLGSVAQRPLALDVWNEIDRFYDSLPAGLFTLDPYEKFLADFMSRRGIPKTFDAMPQKLVIVANDLDSGERAAFGMGDLRYVPVARAVAASSAVPILFAPVRIGDRDYVAGGVGEAGHVELAAETGCELVLVINAVVPVRADLGSREVPTGHGQRTRVRDKGMLWVNNQSWRMVTAARLRNGIDAFRRERPGVDVLLLEPDPSDATMFMYSPMNFTARRVILEDGYTTTLRQLKDPDSTLRRAFEGRGLVPQGPQATTT